MLDGVVGKEVDGGFTNAEGFNADTDVGNREIVWADTGSCSRTRWNFHWRLGGGDRERDCMELDREFESLAFGLGRTFWIEFSCFMLFMFSFNLKSLLSQNTDFSVRPSII